MALMLGGCSCVGEGHDCALGSASCDAGADADTVPDGSAVPPPPFCDLTYAFVDEPEFRPRATGSTAPIPPPPPLSASGVDTTLRPEVGQTGLRSWWVRGDVPLRLSMGVSVGSDISSVPYTMRIVPVVNGRIGRMRRMDGEWEDVLAFSRSPGMASLASTVEIDRASFQPGLNSLSFAYVIETPSAPTTVRVGTFPNLSVFIDRTGRNTFATDESALEVSTEPRLRSRASFVTLGADGRMVAHLDDPGLLESEGLWVHLQSNDVLADCEHDNAIAVIALLDGRPLAFGPGGATSVLLPVGPTERLAFRMPSLDLPTDAGHSLIILRVEGVGHPFEADDGWLSPWVAFPSMLFLLEW
ncbi:MAG: hypothetical protein VYE22_36205 [Myxococcota bacterium]|nr:hypothetical protein [Myxococcota bacterium]